jgi:hypothetical protein
MRSNLRSAFLSLTLLVVSILVALLLCEIALRVVGFSYPSFHRPDDRVGLRLRPNAEGWFRSEGDAFVKINGAGFRDRERSLKKPSDTFRIIVLGDSMIEALQVDFEKTFTALLEQQLNACRAFGNKKVEVLNFGVSSYGTAQELLLYRHIGSKYSPDLVLVAFFAGNDVRNNSRSLEPDSVRPFFTMEGDKLAEDRSFAESAEFRRRTNLLRTVLERLRVSRTLQAAYYIKDGLEARGAASRAHATGPGGEAGIDDAVYSDPRTSEWRDAWALTERLFAQLRDEVQASGAKPVILSLSSGMQVHPDPNVRADFFRERGITDIFYPNRRIEKVASDLGVQSILLGPSFQEAAERDKAFFHGFPNTRMGTGHWNEAGNRMAATVVARELCGTTSTLTQRK